MLLVLLSVMVLLKGKTPLLPFLHHNITSQYNNYRFFSTFPIIEKKSQIWFTKTKQQQNCWKCLLLRKFFFSKLLKVIKSTEITT